MANNTARTVRIAGIVFSAILTLLLLRSFFHRSSSSRHSSRLRYSFFSSKTPTSSTLAFFQRLTSFFQSYRRVEEPVVVILVHPSPSLNKAANFELKRAIARTWAKDVEDFGASVFFVGEHDGETVMRRPSEFQGRAQSLSTRFGPISLGSGSSGAGAGADESSELGYSKEEPMRKMLIPSVLENGQADDASGLLKVWMATDHLQVYFELVDSLLTEVVCFWTRPTTFSTTTPTGTQDRSFKRTHSSSPPIQRIIFMLKTWSRPCYHHVLDGF